MKVMMVPAGPVLTNSYLIVDEQGVGVVVDPGYAVGLLNHHVKQNGWRIEAIVATHGHFDHVAGNAEAVELWAAPLYMHPEAIPIATSAAEHAAWFGIESPDSPPPDETLEQGESLEVASLTFAVRHTPGHSPGGITLLADGHAIVGDTLFAGSIGRTDLPHSDHGQLMRSIREQLMTLPDETVVLPGHGNTTTIGEERRTNPFRVEWEAAR